MPNEGLKVGSLSNNDLSGIELQDDSDANFIAANDTNNNGFFGIHFDSTSDINHYGLNSATGNSGAGPACNVSISALCRTPPDFCDEGSGNLSFGANLVPGLPPC